MTPYIRVAAILLLVFKDTILSLVASVQLTAQDMVRVGDWIEMPQFGADGDVVHVQLHKDYVKNKEEELADYNAVLATEVDAEVNRRRLTNVGTFRAYAYSYLKNHPRIHEGMTLMVRQLSPGPEGLPLEIYCFTSTTDWAVYEDIQNDRA